MGGAKSGKNSKLPRCTRCNVPKPARGLTALKDGHRLCGTCLDKIPSRRRAGLIQTTR